MTDDKFIMFGLDDERSKDLADVLGNKTCKKILDHLADVKEASEKDISEALNMPINTVEYNLKKLVKSGLVDKSKNYFWSVKGRKIEMFKLAKKHIIISPKNKRVDMSKLKTVIPVILIAAIAIAIAALIYYNHPIQNSQKNNSLNIENIKQFSSIDDLKNFLKASQNNQNNYGYDTYRAYAGAGAGAADGVQANGAMAPSVAKESSGAALDSSSSSGASSSGSTTSAESHSNTNNQVEGVDEADITKNDGKYIYTISGNKVVIVNSYPANEMNIESEINLSNVNNLYVNGDKLIVLSQGYIYHEPVYSGSGSGSGSGEGNTGSATSNGVAADTAVASKMIAPCYGYRCGGYSDSVTNVFVYDIKDRKNPVLESNLSFEGNYVDSRMINNNVYLISSKYANIDNPRPPIYYANGLEKDIPLSSVYYFDYPDNSYVFDTISSINLESNYINSKVYLLGGNGNIYATDKNIYITYQKSMSGKEYYDKMIQEVYLQVLPDELKNKVNEIANSNSPYYEKQNSIYNIVYNYSISLNGNEKSNFDKTLSEKMSDFQKNIAKEKQKTAIHKISIDKDDINYVQTGEVLGTTLNQFSMDEYNDYFRIATTTGESWNGNSNNNVYILDQDLKQVGTLENLAPGERIYSTRFMGDRAYLVTFKNVDPLFVIDLKDPTNPQVLGYLKIPGYSDYLHPYDSTHVIGIGKDANESIDQDKVHSPGAIYYTAIKGLKISLFDVSDVENPTEVSKYIIGERGTDSSALYEHKAFLFDKDKKIIVIPVTEAKLVNVSYGYSTYEQSETVFQGAYVLNIDLDSGISLKGKITHINDKQKLGPAKDESIGATRKDYSGTLWTKKAEDHWTTDAPGYYGSIQSDYNIDSFPGGINNKDYMYDYKTQIQRSLFMDDTLYTVSQSKIKANDLNTIDEIKSIDLGYTQDNYPILYSKTMSGGGVAVPEMAVD